MAGRTPSETRRRVTATCALVAAFVAALPLGAAPASQPSAERKEGQPRMSNRIVIKVGARTFAATLTDNATTAALRKLLPLSITMSELNGNEKLFRLPNALPVQEFQPSSIQTGDLMLYGSRTLVLFYKSFPTSYSYTKLGRVDDPTGLADALGPRDVAVVIDAAPVNGSSAPQARFIHTRGGCAPRPGR
jgi:hypothetical protein